MSETGAPKSESGNEPGEKPPWKPGPLVIPVLALLTGNAALSLDMYLPSFPAIAADMGVAAADVQVTMSSFLAGFALGQILYGPLSDRFGRRPVILACLVVYAAISLFCAFSDSISEFVVLRFFQGLAGAAGAVLGRAVIRDIFEGEALAKAMALLMLMLTMAPMAAPLMGSLVLDWLGWRAVFLVLTGYALVWFALIALMIPESLKPEHRRALHPGVILSGFASFVSHRRAMGYTMAACLGFAGMFSYIAATPFLFMEMYGISPQGFSLFFSANVLGMAACSATNRHLIGRYSADSLLLLFSGLLLVAGLLLLVTASTGIGGVWGLALPLFLYVGSVSVVAGNGMAGALQHFGHMAGTASSAFGFFQFVGGAVAGAAMAGFGDGTPMPMALFILACGAGALISVRFFARA